MTDPLGLDRLVELAEAAQDPEGWYDPDKRGGYHIDGPDLAFIVALSPSTVLALVRELREARTALEMVRDWQDFDSALGIEALREEVAAALRDKP